MRVGSVGLLPSSLKWLFNCCGKLALLQLAFEKFISESENKTINNFHLWRQFGCSLRFNCTVFLFFSFFSPLQLKACARVWKQGWWMWPCGWGPAPTIPEETRLQGGIQYPELSLRNCPNKKGTSPGSVTVCYLALWNDQVWSAEGSHSITDGNLNVCMFCFNTILVDRPVNKNTVSFCLPKIKLCTVASLPLAAVGTQQPLNRHCDKTLTIFKLCNHVTCLYSLLLLIKSSFF